MAEASLPQSQSKALSRRLTLALVVPIALLIIVAVALGAQIMRMTSDAHWVDHSDEVVGKTNELAKQIIDQEAGARGYLVTGDPLFLQPYRLANPVGKMNELEALVQDSPAQTTRIEAVKKRYVAWTSGAGDVDHKSLADLRSLDAMKIGKREMDDVRASIDALLAAELDIRQERTAAAAASRTTTQYLFIGLFAVAAVLIVTVSRAQLVAISSTYGDALATERETRKAIEDRDWIAAGTVKLAEKMRGELSLEQLGTRALETLAPYLGATVGNFYSRDAGKWKRRAKLGTAGDLLEVDLEGTLVGRAASSQELVHLDEVPDGYLDVESSTGSHSPASVVILPAVAEGVTYGVVELAFLGKTPARAIELLDRLAEGLGIAIRTTENRMRLRELFEESQRQAEELQTQQEELRVANEELEERSTALREAHAQVEMRQEELEVTNQRLEEQAHALMASQQELIKTSTEVERASRYKSEFLANMSHELRTPLNSSLILSKLLADNKHGNLTDEQVKFASTIYQAGNDLLALINDVLDLSKVEAGKTEVHAGAVPIERMTSALERTFEPVAKERGLAFAVSLEPGAPEVIETDSQRVEQILKNLISNALKFTEKGHVTLKVGPFEGNMVRFRVEDTGIGIPAEHLASIFEAFRQVDATIQRKYGGTGLGLSIARDYAKLLGGDLKVESTPGQGSAFILTLPLVYQAAPQDTNESPRPLPPPSRLVNNLPRQTVPGRGSQEIPAAAIADDRAALETGKRTVLVVEDDVSFAQILVDLAHESGFQALVSHEADVGVAMARKYAPDAVLLDVNLPDHTGLSVLDRLKRDPKTRHIPVHVVSEADHSQAALSMGALGYLIKPVKREDLKAAFTRLEERFAERLRRLLIVEDDATQRESLSLLLGGTDVEITAVGSVKDALAALAARTFDCVVTDLTLPDASGFELLEKMGLGEQTSFPPVIVYTGRSLTQEEETHLRKYSSSIIVKGARSPERLLDEVTLFLHRVESDLPPERRRMLKEARDREALFDGRQIMVVEDDVRNIFALSNILEPKGAKVVVARNGREALEVLAKTPDVDLVLMDIMMPEMDGLACMRAIRKETKWAKLPIVALTAKAMKDDQERCLAAGANDFITKPIDVEMLLSLLRVWMPKMRVG